MRPTSLSLIFFLAAFSSPLFAQKSANNWYMGFRQGITFKSGVPQKLTDGKVNSTASTSTISDEQGNLLFYTDGEFVWDRTHNQMPNGYDLAGKCTFTRSLIVPKPGDKNSFYIFTNNIGLEPCQFDAYPREPAYYSEVNLCLNSGLGDVVQVTKNTALFGISAERIAATKHANGTDYWVLFHKWGNNDFYAYQVTASGINPNPVISSTGDPQNDYGNWSGDLKFSPNGKKIVMANLTASVVEIFDFDATTGVMSNPIKLPPRYRKNTITPDRPNSLEFSPDSRMLYVNGTSGYALFQYDLNLPTASEIIKSREIVAGDTLDVVWPYIAGIQLGPDGKIYCAMHSWTGLSLSVVNKPNEKGLACEYAESAVSWNEAELRPNGFIVAPWYLPVFVSSYFDDTPYISAQYDCIKPKANFTVKHPYRELTAIEVASIQWNFDDVNSGTANTANQLAPDHQFVAGGLHTVTASIELANGRQLELKYQVSIPEEIINGDYAGLGPDRTICPRQPISLDASNMGGQVEWSTGQRTPTIIIDTAGLYWATVCRDGCRAIDSVLVTSDDLTGILGPDTLLCENLTYMLDVGNAGDVIFWNSTDSSDKTFTVTRPGTYKVGIRRNGCLTVDALEVTFCEEALFIPNIFTPNGDDANEVFSIQGIENGAWSLTVYNRQGKIVFASKRYNNDWNGDNLVDGIYYFYIVNTTTSRGFKGWLKIVK